MRAGRQAAGASNATCCPETALVECAALLVRGGAVWQLVGLITRRSQVQILPPLPRNPLKYLHIFGPHTL
jgi:hypothetical protein